MFTKYFGTHPNPSLIREGLIGAVDVLLNILTDDKNVMI